MSNGVPSGPQVRERLAYNLWNDERWEKFRAAVNKFHDKGHQDDSSQEHNYPNTYGSVVAVHHYGHAWPGNVGKFMAWHRQHLIDLETQLQKISGDCSLTLPFWNSNLDANLPGDSNVWSANRYGGKGPSGAGMRPMASGHLGGKACSEDGAHFSSFCLTDGIAANWKTEPTPGTPASHTCSTCVFRNPNQWGGPPAGGGYLIPWASVIARARRTHPDNFKDFDYYMEQTVHGLVHAQIVHGSMGDLYKSPRDPIFFAHHAMVDRTFAWYQAYWSNQGQPLTGSCRGCYQEGLPFYRDKTVDDLIGKYDREEGCIGVPRSNPLVCLKFRGEVPDPK
jgi:hypothetical protein